MKIQSIDLNLLVAFDAFMTERNVTRAGQRLGLSQSAASGALARLRILFDDPLFVRARGGVVPTRKAEELAGAVRDGLAHLQNALDSRTTFLAESAERIFRVAMSDSASLVLLPELLEYIGTEAPACTLRVTRMATHDAGPVLDGEAELAVGVIKTHRPGLEYKTVLEEDMVSMVRRGHPLCQSRLTAKRFAKAQHLLVSALGKRRGRMDGLLERLGVSRDVQLVVPDWTVAALILAKSDYLLTGPASIATALARSHDLAILRLPASLRRTSPIACGWHTRLQQAADHRWLRDAVAHVATEVASSAARAARGRV